MFRTSIARLAGSNVRCFITPGNDDYFQIDEILQGSTAVEYVEGKLVTLEDHQMVTTGEAKEDLGKLAVFAGVHKFPARVKCAILSWHALVSALKGEGTVSTENEAT